MAAMSAVFGFHRLQAITHTRLVHTVVLIAQSEEATRIEPLKATFGTWSGGK